MTSGEVGDHVAEGARRCPALRKSFGLSEDEELYGRTLLNLRY
jgi:hypothetical protein